MSTVSRPAAAVHCSRPRRIFGEGLLEPETPKPAAAEAPAPRRRPSAPSANDRAWKAGFDCGIEGIDAAAPSHLSNDERAAFTAGHDQGFAEYRETAREHIEGQARAWEALYSDRDVYFAC